MSIKRHWKNVHLAENVVMRMKNCFWLEPEIFFFFCSDVVFSSALAVWDKKLAGHLWASQSCCDCVISLLMKKPGEAFDLETAFCATVPRSDWETKPSNDLFPFFLSMFAYLLWCFNNPNVPWVRLPTATVWLVFSSDSLRTCWVEWFVYFLSSCWRQTA